MGLLRLTKVLKWIRKHSRFLIGNKSKSAKRFDKMFPKREFGNNHFKQLRIVGSKKLGSFQVSRRVTAQNLLIEHDRFILDFMTRSSNVLKLFLSKDFLFCLEQKLKRNGPIGSMSVHVQFPKSSLEVKNWSVVNKSCSHEEQTSGRMGRKWETQRGAEVDAEPSQIEIHPKTTQRMPPSILEENVEAILSESNGNSSTFVNRFYLLGFHWNNRKRNSKQDPRTQENQPPKMSLDCLFGHLFQFYKANFDYEKEKLASSLSLINERIPQMSICPTKTSESKFMINPQVRAS